MLRSISPEKYSEANLLHQYQQKDPTLEISRTDNQLMFTPLWPRERMPLIDHKDKNSIDLTSSSPWDILKASYKYSLSHLKREKKQAFIGCTTICQTVVMAIFICVFLQHTTSMFYNMALGNVGDVDIQLTSISHTV